MRGKLDGLLLEQGDIVTFNEARALCAGSSPGAGRGIWCWTPFNEARALCAGSSRIG